MGIIEETTVGSGTSKVGDGLTVVSAMAIGVDSWEEGWMFTVGVVEVVLRGETVG